MAHPYPGDHGGINPPKPIYLVIFVPLVVKDLFKLGRSFLWPKPERCPRCDGRLWGHGFVPAYFDGYDQPLWLKRYRCPDCKGILRLRPRAYFKRFQASIQTIRDCLTHWTNTHNWKSGPSPPRQRHWVKALRGHLVLHEGLNRIQDLVAGFDRLWSLGIIPVSRSL